MTLEQLRIFVAVAEHEHVTQAARDLNLTQSATSAAIAALEGRYETKLFDRIGRRIALTEAGRMFLIEAKAVLQRAGAAETMLADFAGLKRGALSLAASQTVGNYWLPRLLHRYRSRYPGIALSLSLGNTETVAASGPRRRRRSRLYRGRDRRSSIDRSPRCRGSAGAGGCGRSSLGTQAAGIARGLPYRLMDLPGTRFWNTVDSRSRAAGSWHRSRRSPDRAGAALQ